MPDSFQIHPRMASYGSRWAEAMADFKHDVQKIEFMRRNLPELISDTDLFIDIVTSMSKGAGYPDIHRAMMFDNEVLLYIDPGRMFSIRLFLWETGDMTPVHDHNSWGVIGPVFGKLDVLKFSREDDQSLKGHARLKQVSVKHLYPGQIDDTLPLNEGIHQIGNTDSMMTLSVGLYGTPIRRPFIHGFDLEHERVYRIYSPKTRKKLLASRVLKQYGQVE